MAESLTPLKGLGITWQRTGMNEEGTVKYLPVGITPIGTWEKEDDLLIFLGTAASMSRLSSLDPAACMKRILKCIELGHHSVLEHANFSVIIDCDRGTTHAIVRHRHCAFTQSSTVYGKFQGYLEIMALPTTDPITGEKVQEVTDEEDKCFSELSKMYSKLKETGLWGERTRDHLPISLHARLFMTTNLREWMYFIQRRKDPTTSVRIHVLALELEALFKANYPRIYEAMEQWYSKHPL